MQKHTEHQAYIVTVSMGYGHRRPAHALRHLATPPVDWPTDLLPIIVANDYPSIPTSDKRLWTSGQGMYETISRYRHFPVIGQLAWAIMDYMQKIEDFPAPGQPRPDLSKPSVQLKQIYGLIKKGFGKHLIEMLNQDPKPLITTFFSVAYFAEEHGYKGDIYCVCTDSDVSRAWAPLHPEKTRINYLAPSQRVYERLQLYSVPEKQITLTGFPLPDELIGKDDYILKQNLATRVTRLSGKSSEPVHIMYPIGGAGAQADVAISILKSIRPHLDGNTLRITLVAGSRPEVNTFFTKTLQELKLDSHKNVSLIFHENTFTMFELFNEALHTTDLIWTKPSELAFFAGLGLPIIMTQPLGSQEDFNRQWLLDMGAGFDQGDPAKTADWLMEWIADGRLAKAAQAGYKHAPHLGVQHITQRAFGE